jgi:hypothetical protein
MTEGSILVDYLNVSGGGGEHINLFTFTLRTLSMPNGPRSCLSCQPIGITIGIAIPTIRLITLLLTLFAHSVVLASRLDPCLVSCREQGGRGRGTVHPRRG